MELPSQQHQTNDPVWYFSEKRSFYKKIGEKNKQKENLFLDHFRNEFLTKQICANAIRNLFGNEKLGE